MSARDDYAAGGEAAYTGMEGDSSDSRAMQPFAADQSRPWWEGVIAYGLTKAIDNRFAPPNVQGNTAPGSYAGQNGRTYNNAPGGGTQAAQAFGVSPLVLLALGAAVLIIATR